MSLAAHLCAFRSAIIKLLSTLASLAHLMQYDTSQSAHYMQTDRANAAILNV